MNQFKTKNKLDRAYIYIKVKNHFHPLDFPDIWLFRMWRRECSISRRKLYRIMSDMDVNSHIINSLNKTIKPQVV